MARLDRHSRFMINLYNNNPLVINYMIYTTFAIYIITTIFKRSF